MAAPGLYGRLRAALGVDDPWSELEPEDEQQWGVLREAPPIAREPETAAPEPAEPAPEPVVEAPPAVATEPEAAEAPAEEPAAEAAAEEPDAQAEPEAAAEPDAYETSVWSQPARVEEPPAEEAAPAEDASPAEDEADDDTAEIAPTPLTPGPAPRTPRRAICAPGSRPAGRACTARRRPGRATTSPPREPDEPDSSA